MTETSNEPIEILAAFQGGGAKGIAYAGALEALEANKYAFRAVAGTSAGSIAACLVAARFTSAEVGLLIPQLLGRLTKSNPAMLSRLHDPRTLGDYTLEGVRELLESTLRGKIREPGDENPEDVTFRELMDATGIELNILVTVAPGSPMVLNAYSSPNCQVSYAVVGSSAIPFIMNPQMITTQPGGRLSDAAIGPDPEAMDGWAGWFMSANPLFGMAARRAQFDAVVHQRTREASLVVDGGLWANFPGLCFNDQSLRHFYGAPDLSEFPSVGFVLDTSLNPADTAKKPSIVKRVVSAVKKNLLGLVVDAVNYPIATFTLPAFAIMIGAGFAGYQLWAHMSSPSVIEVLVSLAATAILIWIGAIGFAIGFAGRYAVPARSALGTLIGGLTSVTVSVPPWVGAHPNSRIIRVPASSGLISTTDFNPSDVTIRKLIERAATSVAADLDAVPLSRKHDGRRVQHEGDLRFVNMDDLESETDIDRIFGWGFTSKKRPDPAVEALGLE